MFVLHVTSEDNIIKLFCACTGVCVCVCVCGVCVCVCLGCSVRTVIRGSSCVIPSSSCNLCVWRCRCMSRWRTPHTLTQVRPHTHTLVMPEHAVEGGLRHRWYLCVQVRAVALDLRAVQQWIWRAVGWDKTAACSAGEKHPDQHHTETETGTTAADRTDPRSTININYLLPKTGTHTLSVPTLQLTIIFIVA